MAQRFRPDGTPPTFDELPLGKGNPPYSAWGLWGEDDSLGTLVLIHPYPSW